MVTCPHTFERSLARHTSERYEAMPAALLWIIAVALAVVGVVQLVQGQILFGLVLVIAACLVGPGGYSLFRSRA